MTDQPPDTGPPIVAPVKPLNDLHAVTKVAPYALALACLAAAVFDPNLQGSADTVLKLLLGAALLAINPAAKSEAP